jgi:hypothetical protein
VGRATVVVRVKAAAPRFMTLKHPNRLGRGVRQLSLTVAASIPSTLTAGGRRFSIDRRAQRVSVPIRPGRGAVQLVLTLRAGGKTSRVTLPIPRS